MTLWLAGMAITADRLNDYTPDEETASGLVPAANFTVNSFYASRTGGTVFVHCYLNYSGSTITPSGGNITDTAMCTLPNSWWPPTVLNALWGSTVDGDCVIGTDGVITLRTSNGSITSGQNLRVTATWNAEP